MWKPALNPSKTHLNPSKIVRNPWFLIGSTSFQLFSKPLKMRFQTRKIYAKTSVNLGEIRFWGKFRRILVGSKTKSKATTSNKKEQGKHFKKGTSSIPVHSSRKPHVDRYRLPYRHVIIIHELRNAEFWRIHFWLFDRVFSSIKTTSTRWKSA